MFVLPPACGQYSLRKLNSDKANIPSIGSKRRNRCQTLCLHTKMTFTPYSILHGGVITKFDPGDLVFVYYSSSILC